MFAQWWLSVEGVLAPFTQCPFPPDEEGSNKELRCKRIMKENLVFKKKTKKRALSFIPDG